MKSLKAQLMAAIAMTLVAALTIGSSTYAWFTMNPAVSAQGMNVQTNATGGIVIASYDPTMDTTKTPAVAKGWSTYSTTATAYRSADYLELSPVSTVNGTDWYTANAGDVASPTKKSGEDYAKQSISDPYASGYYLYNLFNIQASGNSSITGSGLYITNISVTKATNSSEALNKAIRVAVKVTEKTATGTTVGTPAWYFFRPDASYAHGTAWSGVKSDKETGTIANSYGATSSTTDSVQISTQKDSSKNVVQPSTDVEIYVYYDGEDANCYTNNTLGGVDGLSVSVDFKVVKDAA